MTAPGAPAAAAAPQFFDAVYQPNILIAPAQVHGGQQLSTHARDYAIYQALHAAQNPAHHPEPAKRSSWILEAIGIAFLGLLLFWFLSWAFTGRADYRFIYWHTPPVGVHSFTPPKMDPACSVPGEWQRKNPKPGALAYRVRNPDTGACSWYDPD